MSMNGMSVDEEIDSMRRFLREDEVQVLMVRKGWKKRLANVYGAQLPY